MCTSLLRGALHKDHFSKITTWLAFIPYFWKPSCFLRLPLLPLFLLPSPPPSPPLPSLSCFSFHMFVLFFLIFPLCKKWKAENRMSEGGKTQEAKAATVHRWNHCLQCWDLSFLCTDSYGLQYGPKTTSIYITLCKPSLKHRQCKTFLSPSAVLLYTNVIFSQHDKRNSIDQPQAAA